MQLPDSYYCPAMMTVKLRENGSHAACAVSSTALKMLAKLALTATATCALLRL